MWLSHSSPAAAPPWSVKDAWTMVVSLWHQSWWRAQISCAQTSHPSAFCFIYCSSRKAGKIQMDSWTTARLFFTSVQNHHVVTLLHHFFHWKKYSFLFFSKHILLSASWLNNFHTRALDKSSRIIIHAEKCFPDHVQRDPFSTELGHSNCIMAARMAAVVYAFSCFKYYILPFYLPVLSSKIRSEFIKSNISGMHEIGESCLIELSFQFQALTCSDLTVYWPLLLCMIN